METGCGPRYRKNGNANCPVAWGISADDIVRTRRNITETAQQVGRPFDAIKPGGSESQNEVARVNGAFYGYWHIQRRVSHHLP